MADRLERRGAADRAARHLQRLGRLARLPQRDDVFVALIIIGREIAISALREWMAQIGASKSVAVHMLGKLKTMSQMVAIPFLLYDGTVFGVIDTGVWGHVLIWISAVLTVWSMAYYLQKALPEIRAKVPK